MDALTFVTGNAKKLAEVKQILGADANLISEKIDLPELQGESAQDIAREKCRTAMRILGRPVLTEDTCLCFDAMDGLPGPYIKWFLKKLGHSGLNKMLDGFTNRKAYALCIFALGNPDSDEIMLFEGRCDGIIVQARGPNNFGWDPIFQPDGFTQTFAEMEKQTKNSISHRSRALEKLKQYRSNIVYLVPN